MIINIIYYATGAKEFCTAINPGTLYRTIFIHDDDVATYDDGGVDDGNDDCIDGNDDCIDVMMMMIIVMLTVMMMVLMIMIVMMKMMMMMMMMIIVMSTVMIMIHILCWSTIDEAVAQGLAIRGAVLSGVSTGWLMISYDHECTTSLCEPFCPSIYLSIHQCYDLSIYSTIDIIICPSIYSSILLSVHLSIYLSINNIICTSIHPSIL